MLVLLELSAADVDNGRNLFVLADVNETLSIKLFFIVDRGMGDELRVGDRVFGEFFEFGVKVTPLLVIDTFAFVAFELAVLAYTVSVGFCLTDVIEL